MVKPIVSLLGRLRSYIVTRIHIGHLHPGDRLPSYRSLAERWDVDHRMIARAYRALEAEGLVEIRGRSGVYLREQERIGGEVLSETADWVATSVLTEAWQRRIKIPELPELLRRCIASVQLRAACIESTEDHRFLLCREVHRWFGFEAEAVDAELPVEEDEGTAVDRVRLDELPESLGAADVLITTTFHAHQVRPVAELLQKPFVAVSMHPVAAETFLDRLDEGPLTVVCVDPRFGERIRSIAGPERRERVRVVLASDRDALAELGPDQPALVTTAAQARLQGGPSPILQNIPAFAPDSAAEIAFLLIRLNLESISSGT